MTFQAVGKQRLPILVAALLFSGAASSALADPVTIFSTLGSSNGTGLAIGSGVEDQFAYSFTPSSSYILNSISVAVWYESGPNQLTVYLASGLSQPGSPIESFSLTGLSPFPGKILTATSSLNPTLFAGTRYWVVVSAADLADTTDAWETGPVAIGSVPGMLAVQSEFTSSPVWFSSPGIDSPSALTGAFAVTGTPAPEPTTGAYCLLVLAVLGLVIRRRHA